MRLLVLSDIHADGDGLEQVLAHSRSFDWQGVLLLGDLIGYGREPGRTLALLESLPVVASLEGNHEYMLKRLRSGFPPSVSDRILEPLELCLSELSAGQLDALAALPASHVTDRWQAVHGHPGKHRFEYLLSSVDARRAEASFQADLLLLGHTHLPGLLLKGEDGRWVSRPARLDSHSWRIPEGVRAIANPGSVWQNRDGQAGGSYGLLDITAPEETVFTVQRLP